MKTDSAVIFVADEFHSVSNAGGKYWQPQVYIQIVACWQHMWLTTKAKNLCEQQVEEITPLLATVAMWIYTEIEAQVNLDISIVKPSNALFIQFIKN
jgi:hypothetical protein